MQIDVVTAAPTNTITFAAAATTKFAHPESTKVAIIQYNQVQFYYTATATFDVSSVIGGLVDLQVDDFYTRYYDHANTTGFGWFAFYNSVTGVASTNSNAIPYADFGENSVKKILDNFFSALNQKETSLITHADAMSYLNEAYTIATNELNLINIEYNVPTVWALPLVAGTAEYALPANFGHLLGIGDQNGKEIKNISERELVTTYMYSSADIFYYIRGVFIGFYPTPTSNTAATIVNIAYQTISTKLTSLYDNVVMPLGNYYGMIDYMLYRACPKLGRADEQARFASWQVALNRLKITANKQNCNRDSWSIDPSSNV
jgi:hypothetical protein